MKPEKHPYIPLLNHFIIDLFVCK